MMRVGIVGLGGMGGVHGSKYAHMQDVQLFGFDATPAKRTAFCDRTGATECVSFEDLVSKCDYLDVCLPTDLHLEYGLKAIAAGKAVLMEKPMALDLPGCLQLMNAAEKAGVPLMPAQVVRYFPDYAKGHAMVASGMVGRVGAARTRRGGKMPLGAGGWFRDTARSGGVLLDLAVHDLDWLRWTLGEPMHVTSRSIAIDAPWEGEWNGDYALTTIGFESGAVAYIEATWMDPAGFRTTFEVCGSEGMIEHDSKASWTLRTSTEGGVITEAPVVSGDDPYYRQARAFLEAVSGGTPLPVTAYDGAMAVSMARAAIESARTGRTMVPDRP
ncbi:MAG: Gfo/Idh/MocA family oxidoreductase [Chthonomonas sp.]|nr:Gfo/Idh/MocA family oxidoreductase [Chthonomonas sp.]